MPLQAEQLPPEIWLYIFTFLEGHDLVRAFSCLNSSFNSLLRSSHLQLFIRMKQNESNEHLPNATWSHINRENIYALAVGRRKANCLIQFLRWNASYLIRLSSLSVYLRKSNSYYNIQFLIFALDQLPSLNRLRIKYTAKFDRNIDDLQPLMTTIFSSRFPTEKYSLIFDTRDISLKTSTWSINPFVRYLHIDSISFSNLLSILSFIPQLYSLRAEIYASSLTPDNNILLTHLRKIHLQLSRSHFTDLQMLKDMTPNLQNLQLRGQFNGNDNHYFEENLWHKLLDNIQYFYVHLEDSAYSESKKTAWDTYLPSCLGKSWFSYQETEFIRTTIIRFQSSLT